MTSIPARNPTNPVSIMVQYTDERVEFNPKELSFRPKTKGTTIMAYSISGFSSKIPPKSTNLKYHANTILRIGLFDRFGCKAARDCLEGCRKQRKRKMASTHHSKRTRRVPEKSQTRFCYSGEPRICQCDRFHNA